MDWFNKGLRGAAADSTSDVTIASLWAYVSKRVPQLTARLAAKASPPLSPQRPEIAVSPDASNLMNLRLAGP
jgi:hypothetical protein